MATALQKTIKSYIDSNGLSVAGMEREAGLRINVIRNILRGQSKRPTAETLQALAKLMGCSIQDLLFENDERVNSEQGADDTVIENPGVLKDILDLTFEVCHDKQVHLTTKQISSILENAYLYSMKKTPPGIDRVFIEWYLSKILD